MSVPDVICQTDKRRKDPKVAWMTQRFFDGLGDTSIDWQPCGIWKIGPGNTVVPFWHGDASCKTDHEGHTQFNAKLMQQLAKGSMQFDEAKASWMRIWNFLGAQVKAGKDDPGICIGAYLPDPAGIHEEQFNEEWQTIIALQALASLSDKEPKKKRFSHQHTPPPGLPG